MGDITDLFSVTSRTRISPGKSYTASYVCTNALADSGATLSVPNNMYYSVVFRGDHGGSETFTWNVIEGATTKETWSGAISASTIYYGSPIFKNTSGSTQTVKVQAQASGSNTTIRFIQIIYGTLLVMVPSGTSVNLPINAYVTNLEMMASTPFIPSNSGTSKCSILNLTQDDITVTTSLVSNLNLYVSGFNCTAEGVAATLGVNCYIAFDFDGKTLAL